MENKLNLPFAYTAVDEDEMTYLDGGNVVDDAVNTATSLFHTVVNTAYVLGFAVALFQGVVNTRLWYKSYVKENPDSSVSDRIDAALGAVAADMSLSAWNTVRDLYRGICMLVAAPISIPCILL